MASNAMELTNGILERFFNRSLSSKVEDVKNLICSLPINEKITLADSRFTLTEMLHLIVRLERSYLLLHIFPTKSIFSRKEDCLNSYNSIFSTCNQFIKSCPNSNVEYQLAEHLRNLASIRSQMITFYRSVIDIPLAFVTECSSFLTTVHDLKDKLNDMENELNKGFTTLRDWIRLVRITDFRSIKIIRNELNILIELFTAQLMISDLKFMEALMCLRRSKDYLNLFERYPFLVENRTSTRTTPLISWLHYFHSSLMTKYTLYWFDVLVRSGSSLNTIRSISDLEEPNILSCITNFQKSSHALSISIFFDTTCQSYPFLGHGYVIRGSAGEGPKGIESIPAIFNAPLGYTLPSADLYAIVMQITGTLTLGEKSELYKLVYFYDEKLQHTYFIQKLEFRFFLALVFQGCRSQKDRQISEFMSVLSDMIRLQNVVNLLKPK